MVFLIINTNSGNFTFQSDGEMWSGTNFNKFIKVENNHLYASNDMENWIQFDQHPDPIEDMED